MQIPLESRHGLSGRLCRFGAISFALQVASLSSNGSVVVNTIFKVVGSWDVRSLEVRVSQAFDGEHQAVRTACLPSCCRGHQSYGRAQSVGSHLATA